jgi:integrative and conjugative element protein (TIGR02256 family)
MERPSSALFLPALLPSWERARREQDKRCVTELLDPPGQATTLELLRIPKARELGVLLAASRLPFLHFIEARRDDAFEYVIVDVEPEVPQHPLHDIRSLERIAVRFDPDDTAAPDPLALRKDFPRVPHINLRYDEFPRSLCLFEEPYASQKLTWTASHFLRQLHRWLSRTARGELHEPDQPLEQFLMTDAWPAILPPDLFDLQSAGATETLRVVGVDGPGESLTLIVTRDKERSETRGKPFVSVVVEGQPRTHGAIRRQPRTLHQLHDYLAEVDVDLVGMLRTHLATWRTEFSVDDLKKIRLLLVVRLPKRRTDHATPEFVEVWGFVPDATLAELGEFLGVMANGQGFFVPLIGQPKELPNDKEIKLFLLQPIPMLTRSQAAALNDLDSLGETRICAVGVGALGSQVLMNLVRAGYGRWTVIDRDVLLPHNLARHQCDGFALGYSKAKVVCATGNAMFDKERPIVAIVADVLVAKDRDTLRQPLSNAEVILDMSASVPVARHLALDEESTARRISLFLNPSGTALVLLAEDSARQYRLDYLEMLYYRETIRNPDLRNHLYSEGAPLRYANGCRDVTARLSQDAVAVFAGIGSRAVRQAISSGQAGITVWTGNGDLTTRRIDVAPLTPEVRSVLDWKLLIDRDLYSRLYGLREEKLPNETGGVLIGSYDCHRKVVYVLDTIPSPPDSKEWPTLYIRGSEGLRAQVDEINRRSGTWLSYVGEWHSHPDGYGVTPSSDDAKVFDWLTERLLMDGYPPLMAIVGDKGQCRWLFGTLHHD